MKKVKHKKIDVDKNLPYIDQLKYLFKNYPDCFATILFRGYKVYKKYGTPVPEFKYLVDWINEQTPLLNDSFYSMSTKLYWIFNGLTDFPRCKNSACNKKFGQHYNVKVNRGYHQYCSNKCAQTSAEIIAKAKTTKLINHGDENFTNEEKRKETCLKKYGCQYAFQNLGVIETIKKTKEQHIKENPNYWKEREEKSKQTRIANGHDANWHNIEQAKETFKTHAETDPNFLKSISEKAKQTKKEKYGDENYVNVDAIKKTKAQHVQDDPDYYLKISERMKQTKLEKYGDENYVNVEKNKETKLKKYGDKNYNNSAKAMETNISKYGEPNPYHWNSKRHKEIMLKKYGVEHNSQVHEFRLKQQKRYLYNGITFGSMPEIALYIYLTDNGIPFEYQPSVNIWYHINGKRHKYCPDFKVGNEYWEIKGDHFFKEDGTMHNPWKNKNWTEEQKKESDARYEAKHQCMIQNNVRILRGNDYKQYIDYVEEKYGTDYLKQFKKK